MKCRRTALVLISALVTSGCTTPSSKLPTLSNGLYTMESSIQKTGVERDYGGTSQCKLTLHGTSLRIELLGVDAGVWYEGTLTGVHIELSVRRQAPDPLIEAMQLRQVYVGEVTAHDRAEGTMKGYAGTEAYLSGTWRLAKAR